MIKSKDTKGTNKMDKSQECEERDNGLNSLWSVSGYNRIMEQ